MLPGLEQLVMQCAPNVAPSTMMAVIRVESGGNPLALNVNGKQRLARQPASRQEAVAWASWLVGKGYSVDIGLAQVNSAHLARFNASVDQLLDPCTNLSAGARILSENYADAARRYGLGQVALRAAISAYNTGNHRDGFRNGYVGKVVAAAGVPPLTSAAAPKPVALGEPLVYWIKRP